MRYEISELASQKVNEHILISGAARSGTTIVGKLIHTFENVEFNHEPPMIFSLLPLINELPAEHWKLLFETYLYEDFFIDALCGRRINCNRADDSSIWNVKTEKEVNARLEKSVRKSDSESKGLNSHIAIKLPDITHYLPKLKSYYPDSKIVIVRRDAVGTISSMIDKRWFSDDNANHNLIWPFVRYNERKIPYFVDTEDREKWCGLSEIDRCAYYYIKINKAADNIPGRIDLKYRKLLDAPNETVNTLASKLGLNFGPRTQEVIEQIKPTVKSRVTELNAKIHNEFRDELEYYSEQSA